MLFAIRRARVSTKLHLKLVVYEPTICQNKAKLDPDSREDQGSILPTEVIFKQHEFKILTKHHLFLFSDNKQKKYIKRNYVKASCKLACEES